MLLRFTKMHGLGNDFMVLDLVSQHAHILPKHAKQWGDRHTGIGFDQLLLVEAPNNPDVDFRYRIFNSDGSEVEQCGNGARCFARFVLDKRLTAKKQIRVETKGGIIELDIRSDGQISVDMGPPRFAPEGHSVSGSAASHPLLRSKSTGRRSSWPLCRWAIRTPCCASMTSTMPPCTRSARKSNITRAFRHGSTSASSTLSIASARSCGSGSAVPGKPRPVAPGRVQRQLLPSARAGWTRHC